MSLIDCSSSSLDEEHIAQVKMVKSILACSTASCSKQIHRNEQLATQISILASADVDQQAWVEHKYRLRNHTELPSVSMVGVPYDFPICRRQSALHESTRGVRAWGA